MSRSLYQILSVRTINNGWGYPSHWPVSDGPRWWAMFVSWPHTSNTNNISDPRHSSAADQCGDNWANNEDSEFEWSEKYLMFEQENYLISSGSVVHRTRWSVITCTLCHTFWSHHTSEVCWPQNYLVNIILTRCDGCWRNKSEYFPALSSNTAVKIWAIILASDAVQSRYCTKWLQPGRTIGEFNQERGFIFQKMAFYTIVLKNICASLDV